MSNRKRRRRPPTRQRPGGKPQPDLSVVPTPGRPTPDQPTPGRPTPGQPALSHLTSDLGRPPVHQPEPPNPEPPPSPAEMATAIIEAVEAGAVDVHLQPIAQAVRQRQRQLARKVEVDAAARFEVGDPVQLGPEVRPKYLQGATGIVSGWAQKNMLVRLDHPLGRYPAGADISVSPLGVHRVV